MTEFVSAEALARLAAAGDPQVRLMTALAALGADRTQILGARPTGRRGEVALQESERATAAFAELQSLLGATNAQASAAPASVPVLPISRKAWPQTGVSLLRTGTSPVTSRAEVPRATAADRRQRRPPSPGTPPDSRTNAEAGRGAGLVGRHRDRLLEPHIDP
ncbi:hypothetical protein ACFY15_33940 [Streptomyces sp. NPDC001373]|uniref:hypothetical protein n=1 Tax=Streptomyces sp. NPDC001373 TaxID=3364565 RepID=UPI0036B0EE28